MNAESRVRLRAALVFIGIAGTSAGHYLTPPEHLLWHNVFQRLYYLPIVYAAIQFGTPGGLIAAAVSAVSYIPHIVFTWRGWQHYSAHQYAEIVLFFLVAAVTGVLAERSRRRERELRRVYQELENSVEQLRRADRFSAIGQLSAALAHEIRNPLAAIEGAAGILAQPATPPEMREEFLAIVRKECQRLNRLLGQLLDFARPRPPERRPVEIGQILENVVGLSRHSAEKNGVRLRTAVAPGLPPLVADAEQLTQVVLNLAINAVQAMPQGGELLLSASRHDGGVIIQVRDQGEGVPPEHMDKIFDPFFTTKADGTGLGLAVAQQIVTQHGGRIEARRNADRGMTFAIGLPLESR
ncbi:MAG: ATP-binding protein [Bryobacterales bacterium]|nr:ATP-binding protein [Bryobacterales bacterium]